MTETFSWLAWLERIRIGILSVCSFRLSEQFLQDKEIVTAALRCYPVVLLQHGLSAELLDDWDIFLAFAVLGARGKIYGTTKRFWASSLKEFGAMLI